MPSCVTKLFNVLRTSSIFSDNSSTETEIESIFPSMSSSVLAISLIDGSSTLPIKQSKNALNPCPSSASIAYSTALYTFDANSIPAVTPFTAGVILPRFCTNVESAILLIVPLAYTGTCIIGVTSKTTAKNSAVSLDENFFLPVIVLSSQYLTT